MLDLGQQNRQVYILNADIRQLERKKKILSEELERLDASHNAAFKQHLQEIKDLTKRRDDLMVKVKEQKDAYETLTATYQKAKSDLDEYRDKQLADTSRELEQTRQLAEAIEKRATDKQAEVEKRERSANEEDVRLSTWATTLEETSQKLRTTKHNLDTAKGEWEADQSSRDILHGQLTQKIDKLKEELSDLERQRGEQQTAFKNAAGAQALREHKLTEREQKADILDRELSNRQQMLDNQKKQQDEEGIRIQDRWGQIERAIAEYRAKGVVI